MFYICDIFDNKLGIRDTLDEVIEYYTPEEVIEITEDEYQGVDIIRFDGEGILYWDKAMVEYFYTGEYMGEGSPIAQADILCKVIGASSCFKNVIYNKRKFNLQNLMNDKRLSMAIVQRCYDASDCMLYFSVCVYNKINEEPNEEFIDGHNDSWYPALEIAELLKIYDFVNVTRDSDGNGFTYTGVDGVVHLSYEKLESSYSRVAIKSLRIQQLKRSLQSKNQI